MCCNSNNQKSHSCACHQNYLNNPALWSKEKKISMLENTLANMQEQEIEIKKAIEELKK
jgi:hypothetical protein